MMKYLPQGLALLGAIGSTGVEAAAPYCLPGNPCFPSADVLRAFNTSVEGRLIEIEPYGASCYAKTYNAGKCAQLAKNKTVDTWRVENPAGAQYPNFEQAADGSGCPIPDLPSNGAAPNAVQSTCSLGRTSHYVVNATTTDHVVKSVNFAAKYNLRFRVKNTGHCFTGRSLGEGTFSVWTHNMQDVKHLASFVPKNSNNGPINVLSTGPGVNVKDLYTVAVKYGGATIGGMSPTVGATGGWILGGGVGPFGAHFGMGVDNVVQYEVVTADGQVKIANEHENADLFWALRGGGGAFAVTTRVWVKLHPAMKAINTVFGTVTCDSRDSYFKLLDELVDLQLPLGNARQSGAFATEPEQHAVVILSYDMFNQSQAVGSTNSTFDRFSRLQSIPGCKSQLRVSQTAGPRSWLDLYETTVLPITEKSVPIGKSLATLSRIISMEQISTTEGRQKIKKGLRDIEIPIIWQNTVNGAVREVEADATSIHPAWRKAISFLDASIWGDWKTLNSTQQTVIKTASKLLTETFGPAVYYNEQIATGEEWQQAQFGSNYARLLKIKKQVDPKGLFNCQNCVGSEAGF